MAGQRQHQSYPTECVTVYSHCGSSWSTPECCPPTGSLGCCPDFQLNLSDGDSKAIFQEKDDSDCKWLQKCTYVPLKYFCGCAYSS